jgi:hypothetical protein
MKPRNLCNISKSLSSKCSPNRTSRSRVIFYHSRDIGVDCLLFCNHGQGHVQYHGLEWYPICVDQFDMVTVCGSGGQAFESTSHMP